MKDLSDYFDSVTAVGEPASRVATMHGPVYRTSPEGEAFVGTCAACGKQGITIMTFRAEECLNQCGLTEKDALLEAIRGPS